MQTINGTGTKHFGIVKAKEADYYFATVWVTFFYLPVLPLRREKIQFLDLPKQSAKEKLLQGRIVRQYRVMSREKLSSTDILKTYVFGWILIPLLFFGPVVLLAGINEILKKKFPEIGTASSIITAIVLVSWLGIALWKISDWDEDRGYT